MRVAVCRNDHVLVTCMQLSLSFIHRERVTLTHARSVVVHEGQKVIEHDPSGPSQDSVGMSQSLSLVKKELSELLFLFLGEVADDHGQQLGRCVSV